MANKGIDSVVGVMPCPSPLQSPHGNDASHQRFPSARESADERQPLLQNSSEAQKDNSGTFAGKHRLTGMISLLLLGELIASVDNTLLFATAAPIASQLQSLVHSGWLASAYTVGLLATQPLCGRLSEVLGRKSMLVWGYLILTIGCLACGSSNTFKQLVIGRAISGVGGAIVRTLASIIITDIVAKRDVAVYRSYVNIAATAGRSLGGPVGGWIYDAFGWRWLFYIRVPILVISVTLVLSLLALPDLTDASLPTTSPAEQDLSFWQKIKQLDFVGVKLIVSWVATTVTLLDGLGTTSIADPSNITMIAVIVVTGAILAFWELKVTKKPILNLRILAAPNVALSYGITTLQVFAQVSMMFSVPLYLQSSQGASPGSGGLHLVPATVFNTFGAVLAGFVIGRTTKHKALLVSSGLLACVTFTLLLLRWNGEANMSEWETLYIIPGGFATGMALSASFVSTVSFLERPKVAMATGLFFFSSSFGTVCGVSVTNLLVQSQFRPNLERVLQDPHKKEIIDRVTKDFSSISSLHGHTREVVVAAFVKCLKHTYVAGVVASLASSLLSCFLRDGQL